MIRKIYLLAFMSVLTLPMLAQMGDSSDLYNLDTSLKSRSISFENQTGGPGEGGKAVNEQIGPGKKGSPLRELKPGETITLCDIKEAGTIRHIWMTGNFLNFPWNEEKSMDRLKLLRSTVVRAYWDGQEHPSIETPLGDFMGLAHSKVTSYESAAHSIGEMGALNFWIPMPFTEGAKITITNDSDISFPLYYQIDYTIGDEHPEDVGRLHVLFKRDNPTTEKEDFELLPKRTGKGRFLGAVVGIRTLTPIWWGEGEIKVYMDGDTDHPTICGTGSEDWVGLSYGIQQTAFRYHGCNLNFKSKETVKVTDQKTGELADLNREYVSMYRWHMPDPVFWKKECRVTIQQIGCCYFERHDDWSTATFWYEPVPSAPLPEFPDREVRTKDLDELLSFEEK